jgi:uncharacterized repeat protein (TIGR01451 family)
MGDRVRAVVGIAVVAAVAALAGFSGPAAEGRPGAVGACKAGSKPARIGGVTECLKAGGHCRARYDSAYHRYGFHCHTGTLTRKTSAPSTPPPTPPVPAPQADLALALSGPTLPVLVGSDQSFTATITNAGPASAERSTLRIDAPTGATVPSASASSGSCSTGPLAIDCTFGTINAGSTVTVTAVLRLPAGAASISARVTSGTVDPNPANNAATTTVTAVSPSADLAVSIVDSPDPLTVGSNITYAITATNNGPNASETVRVTSTLSFVTSLVSTTSSAGSCVGVLMIDCQLGALASGATATITIVARTLLSGTATTTTTISSATSDPSAANNTATTTTTVTAVPREACAASYPDVCIPPPPPDLNCNQVQYKRFRVIYTVPNPDPHRFDADHDGIGCE